MKIVDIEGDLDLETFLAQPLVAHMASNSADGPRCSPLCFLWEEKTLWIIGHRDDSFPTRVAEDPRCSISIVDFDASAGRLHHVGLRGTAKILPVENRRAHRLLSKYLGSDRSTWDRRRFGRDLEATGGYVFVKFTPETVVVRNQTYSIGDAE